jgi:NAD(P)-dependent dehydrogenase (short-subunit alcohol dehydrogenase family)
LDVSDEASVNDFEKSFGDRKLHLLINNAGVLVRDDLDSFTTDNLIQQFKVNSVGPILTARALLPNLKKSVNEDGSSLIVSITSRMGSVADNSSGGYYGYRASKSALNMLHTSLSIDVKQHGIAAILVHPGYIKTDMTNNNGDMGPDESVERMIKVIERADMSKTGQFFHRDGDILPW